MVWENPNFSSNSRKMTLPVSEERSPSGDNLIERLNCRVFCVKVGIRRILSVVFCLVAITIPETDSFFTF